MKGKKEKENKSERNQGCKNKEFFVGSKLTRQNTAYGILALELSFNLGVTLQLLIQASPYCREAAVMESTARQLAASRRWSEQQDFFE